jgi:branched-subunit amino acid transport protein AzlD
MPEPYHCWTNLTYLQKKYIHLLAILCLKQTRVVLTSIGVGILIFLLVHPSGHYLDKDALAALAIGSLAGYYTAFIVSVFA